MINLFPVPQTPHQFKTTFGRNAPGPWCKDPLADLENMTQIAEALPKITNLELQLWYHRQAGNFQQVKEVLGEFIEPLQQILPLLPSLQPALEHRLKTAQKVAEQFNLSDGSFVTFA
jgi:hypothetical protein